MPVTQTEICNLAIAKVGGKRILTVDDDTEEARLCKSFYPIVRRKLLRSHPWNFAIRREELAASVDTPLYGYTYAFPLTSDTLRVLEVNCAEEEYKIEGRNILTDSPTAKVKILFDEDDESQWDTNFVYVMAGLLAVELAYPITQSRETQESLRKEAELELRQARSFDAQEGVIDQVQASSWLNARY